MQWTHDKKLPYGDAMTWTHFPHTWWRHQMETFSALLAICAGNSPVSGEFPTQRPVTRSFDIFFDLRLNKRLSKQSWGWWFQRLSCPLWRQCNELAHRAGELSITISRPFEKGSLFIPLWQVNHSLYCTGFILGFSVGHEKLRIYSHVLIGKMHKFSWYQSNIIKTRDSGVWDTHITQEPNKLINLLTESKTMGWQVTHTEIYTFNITLTS